MRLYKSHEVNDQNYYQLPKSLFTKERYKGLSIPAKVLYAFLRDRMTLSLRNNWITPEGEVYLLYAREEAEIALDLSNKTVVKHFKELVTYELIFEKRVGQGKTNHLFICHIEE